MHSREPYWTWKDPEGRKHTLGDIVFIPETGEYIEVINVHGNEITVIRNVEPDHLKIALEDLCDEADET